jgi:hypothetical protein
MRVDRTISKTCDSPFHGPLPVSALLLLLVLPGVTLTATDLSSALRFLQQQAADAPAHFAELPKAEPLPKVDLPPDQRAVPPPLAKPPQHKPKPK